MPALVHPGPASVAVIGLGSGETAWAVACRQETRSIDVVKGWGPTARDIREAERLAILNTREPERPVPYRASAEHRRLPAAGYR